MSPPEATLVVQLVVQNGPSANQKVSVSDVLAVRPVFIIGSDPRCHLQLSDPQAAGAHAVVSLKQGEYFIQPQFPKNEVLVNGKRIEGLTRLTPGDTVQIGDTMLGFGQEMVMGRPAPVVAPIVKPVQTRPVVSASQPRITYPAGVTAQRSLAPASAGQSPVVYYPKPESAGGLNFGVVLIAFFIIAAAAGIGGYALSGGKLLNTASAANASGFAIPDGTVLIVMFDADW